MKAVAESKKAQNLAEYIIYMYQMEDLLRAYQFNMEDVRQYVIAHYPIPDQDKEYTSNWFSEMADQMKLEQIEKSGHLSFVQQLVDDLAKLHWGLLKTDKNYFDLYQKAKPHFLNLLLEAGEKAPKHEIQIAFNAIYGQLLAKLRSREVPAEMLTATDTFGDILSYLNWVYFNQEENKVNQN